MREEGREWRVVIRGVGMSGGGSAGLLPVGECTGTLWVGWRAGKKYMEALWGRGGGRRERLEASRPRRTHEAGKPEDLEEGEVSHLGRRR